MESPRVMMRSVPLAPTSACKKAAEMARQQAAKRIEAGLANMTISPVYESIRLLDEFQQVCHVLHRHAGFDAFGHEALAGGGGAFDVRARQVHFDAAHDFERHAAGVIFGDNSRER